jgi:hypothetical protein
MKTPLITLFCKRISEVPSTVIAPVIDERNESDEPTNEKDLRGTGELASNKIFWSRAYASCRPCPSTSSDPM